MNQVVLLRKTSERPMEPKNPSNPAAPRSLRVIIVDDSNELRGRLVEMFSQSPELKVVGEASGVVEALAALELLRPDLVILDLQMRDGNGFDVLRQVRRDHAETKVLVLTNHPEEQYRRRCTELGADYFVSKSNDSNLLLEVAKQVVSN